MLAADDGHTLEHELGVKSKLHREQLTRALKRVILGIGKPPSSPQVLSFTLTLTATFSRSLYASSLHACARAGEHEQD